MLVVNVHHHLEMRSQLLAIVNEEWHKCRKGKQCSEEGESWCGAFHVGSPRHHRMSQLLHANAGPSENFGTIAKPVEVQSQ